jgi:hypothetical protein
MGTRAQELSGFLQELTQLASVWPDLVGVIDPSALGREMVHLRSVQPNILKTPEQMKQEQDQQAIQQQQQQIMEGAPAAAGALKDIATARSTDPTLVNELGL